MNFQNDSILFKEIKLSQVNKLAVVYHSNETIFFSYSGASFTRNVRQNFNNQLKDGRVRFKYFPGALQMISCSNIERTFGEGQFDTAIIHIGLNDLLNYTTVTEVLLQNVLIIADRCKMHGISKIFLNT